MPAVNPFALPAKPPRKQLGVTGAAVERHPNDGHTPELMNPQLNAGYYAPVNPPAQSVSPFGPVGTSLSPANVPRLQTPQAPSMAPGAGMFGAIGATGANPVGAYPSAPQPMPVSPLNPNTNLQQMASSLAGRNAYNETRQVEPYASPFASMSPQAIEASRQTPGSPLFGTQSKTTVGGAYGQPITNITPGHDRLSSAQVLKNATGDQYRPIGPGGDPFKVKGRGPMPRQVSTEKSGRTSATDEAKATFDARRGGLAARRSDYESRTAASVADRTSNRRTREMAKGDARRVRMGNMTFDEQLQAANPVAAAQRKLGEGQIAAATEQSKARLGLEGERLKVSEREGAANRTSREAIAKDQLKTALLGKGIDPATNQPPVTPAQAIQQAEENPPNLDGKTPEEQQILVSHLPPETQKRILEEHNQKKMVDIARKDAGRIMTNGLPPVTGWAARKLADWFAPRQ